MLGIGQQPVVARDFVVAVIRKCPQKTSLETGKTVARDSRLDLRERDLESESGTMAIASIRHLPSHFNILQQLNGVESVDSLAVQIVTSHELKFEGGRPSLCTGAHIPPPIYALQVTPQLLTIANPTWEFDPCRQDRANLG